MASSIKGLIINIYGSLIDSHQGQALAWKDALDEEGIRNSLEEIWDLVGMSYEELIPKLAGVDKNSHRGQEISKRMECIFESKYLPGLIMFPRARELLRKNREQRVLLSTASVIKKEFTEALLREMG